MPTGGKGVIGTAKPGKGAIKANGMRALFTPTGTACDCCQYVPPPPPPGSCLTIQTYPTTLYDNFDSGFNPQWTVEHPFGSQPGFTHLPFDEFSTNGRLVCRSVFEFAINPPPRIRKGCRLTGTIQREVGKPFLRELWLACDVSHVFSVTGNPLLWAWQVQISGVGNSVNAFRQAGSLVQPNDFLQWVVPLDPAHLPHQPLLSSDLGNFSLRTIYTNNGPAGITCTHTIGTALSFVDQHQYLETPNFNESFCALPISILVTHTYQGTSQADFTTTIDNFRAHTIFSDVPF